MHQELPTERRASLIVSTCEMLAIRDIGTEVTHFQGMELDVLGDVVEVFGYHHVDDVAVGGSVGFLGCLKARECV